MKTVLCAFVPFFSVAEIVYKSRRGGKAQSHFTSKTRLSKIFRFPFCIRIHIPFHFQSSFGFVRLVERVARVDFCAAILFVVHVSSCLPLVFILLRQTFSLNFNSAFLQSALRYLITFSFVVFVCHCDVTVLVK